MNSESYNKEYQAIIGDKNSIILKNLPSNLIEEAIIIFKNKNVLKDIEKLEKEKTPTKKNKPSYAHKEAEMLITNYISRVEEKRKKKTANNTKINKNTKRLKIYSLCASLLIIVETILLIIL